MGVKTAILATQPTSYWPFDDDAGSSCHDEAGLHALRRPPPGLHLRPFPLAPSARPSSMARSAVA